MKLFLDKNVIKKKLEKLAMALKNESTETKSMLVTYLKYAKKQASNNEIKSANKQFRELLKSVGLGALIIIPFSPFTIPLVIKYSKKYNIQILPDWFLKELNNNSKTKEHDDE